MTTLDPASKSADQTHGTLISTTWTTIEAGTGIICACLPMLKAPLTVVFPRLLLNSSNKGTNGSHVPHAPRDAGPDSTEPSKNKPSTFDSWSPPESNEDLIIIPSLEAGYPGSAPADNHHAFGKEDDKSIPMGVISKRTDVLVSYGDNDSISSSDISHFTNPVSKGSRHGRVHCP